MKKITPVVIFLIKKQGKYLLTRRKEKDLEDEKYNDVWQIPGGELEFGEKILDGLKRETQEEIGVEIEVLQLIPKIYETIRGNWHGLLLCYLCKMKNQNDRIKLNHEASKYGWFTPEEVKNLRTFPETYSIIMESEKI